MTVLESKVAELRAMRMCDVISSHDSFSEPEPNLDLDPNSGPMEMVQGDGTASVRRTKKPT